MEFVNPNPTPKMNFIHIVYKNLDYLSAFAFMFFGHFWHIFGVDLALLRQWPIDGIKMVNAAVLAAIGAVVAEVTKNVIFYFKHSKFLYMKEVIARFNSETPVFFKHLRNVCMSLGIMALAALQIAPQIGFEVPFVLTALKYTVVGCVFVCGTSQLTCVTPPVVDTPKPNANGSAS